MLAQGSLAAAFPKDREEERPGCGGGGGRRSKWGAGESHRVTSAEKETVGMEADMCDEGDIR